MAWGIGGLGFKSGGLRPAAQPSGSSLSKPTAKPLGQKLGTLASAFALKAKSKIQSVPSASAVVAKEKRVITINRPSVSSTNTSPLSDPTRGMSRIVRSGQSPAHRHNALYKPILPKPTVKPYSPAWGGFRWD